MKWGPWSARRGMPTRLREPLEIDAIQPKSIHKGLMS